MDIPHPTLPTIHGDKTGTETLAQEYESAHRKLAEAVQALAWATCNAIDFYPQGDNAWHQVKAERTEVFRKLGEVQKYVEQWEVHIRKYV